MIDFGREVRRLREEANLSQDALGARVYLSKGHISRIENGHSTVRPDVAKRFDKAFEAKGKLLALLPRPQDGNSAPHDVPRGLPSPPLHLVGREDELATLHSALLGHSTVRICALHGMPGVGKTAVALAAAHRAEDDFPDGTMFFDLGGHTPGVTRAAPSDQLHTMLTLLGVSGDRIPADLNGRANVLHARLRGCRILLVLDNVANAAQVRSLLPSEESCRVLITSRHKLQSLDDAWHVRIDALDSVEAVELFRTLAGDAQPSQAEATRIVNLCDHLPLAVRIAAVRYSEGGWNADRYLDRLADESTRLSALDDGERGVATAFTVSYEGLPAEQRRMLGLLACHPGVLFESDAVDAMCEQPPGEADRLLDRLHEANLLFINDHGYRMHDLVRLFAVNSALPEVSPAERYAAITRLVEHAADRTAAADELLNPGRYRPVRPVHTHPLPHRPAALDWLRVHWPTLARLVDLSGDNGLHRHCWQLAHLLRGFFFHDGLIAPWIATHKRGLTAAQAEGNPAAVGLMLNSMGMAHVKTGAVDAALDCHQQAYAAFTSAGDKRGMIDALSSIAWTRVYRNEPDAAIRDLNSVLQSYRHSGRDRNSMITLRGIALALADLGRFDEAAERAEEALKIAERGSDGEADTEGIMMAANCLAWIEFRADRLDKAHYRYVRAAELADLASHHDEHARAVTGLGNVAARRAQMAARRGESEAAQDGYASAERYWTAAETLSTALHPAVLGEARARLELMAGKEI